MKEVQILFSIPREIQWLPLSFFIRFIQYPKTLRPFKFFGLYEASHVSLKVDDCVFEAILLFGIRKIPYSKWEKLNKVVKSKTVELTEDQYHDSNIFLNASLGIPYAFLELFGILLGKIMKTFFKKELYGNPFTTIRPKFKCSEYLYEWGKVVGKISGLRDPNMIDVRDIDLLFKDK